MTQGSDRLATRHDQRGFQEYAEFFETAGATLFGIAHVPTEAIFGSVVIVPSVYAEAMKNYRREVLLARSLAGTGIAVQRFHYRGTGNSHGTSDQLTFETLVQDVLSAADWLERRAGVTEVAVVGTRAGSIIAAAAARHLGNSAIAAWDPVLDADAWFREIFRARLIGQLKQGEGRPSSRDDPRVALSSAGRLDVLGYSIGNDFYRSMGGRTLSAEVASPKTMLVVQFGGDGPRAEYAALTNDLKARGVATDFRVVNNREAWWFGGAGRDGEVQVAAESLELIDATSTWLADALGVPGSTDGADCARFA